MDGKYTPLVDPYADVPAPTEAPEELDQAPDEDENEPTTWEPVDLGPYLRGEVERPQPSLGIARSDGLCLIYPGREHAVLGETESGKTWFASGCVAAELIAGNRVLYVHYEESDPASTLEKLRSSASTTHCSMPGSGSSDRPVRCAPDG